MEHSPSNVIRQRVFAEGELEAERMLSQKMTKFLEDRIVEGQELQVLLETPGWQRIERIISQKLMESIDTGHADVTATMTDLLRKIYIPVKLAEKAAKDLQENALKEKRNERTFGRTGGTGGIRERRSIFGRRGRT